MFKHLLLAVAALGLASCASTQTAMTKKELLVDTRMTHSVFLEPVDPEQQIIYIKVRNTSKAREFRLQNMLVEEMRSLGYKVTNKPSEANFMLQANIRNYTEKRVAADGTGESLIGAVVGGVLGSTIGEGSGQTVATTLGAVAGGTAGQAFSARTLDITFTAEVDVLIAERAARGQIVNYNQQQSLSQGEGTRSTASFTNQSNWKKYRTKLVSKANKANLTVQEATPVIMRDIVQSLSGLF